MQADLEQAPPCLIVESIDLYIMDVTEVVALVLVPPLPVSQRDTEQQKEGRPKSHDTIDSFT